MLEEDLYLSDSEEELSTTAMLEQDLFLSDSEEDCPAMSPAPAPSHAITPDPRQNMEPGHLTFMS